LVIPAGRGGIAAWRVGRRFARPGVDSAVDGARQGSVPVAVFRLFILVEVVIILVVFVLILIPVFFLVILFLGFGPAFGLLGVLEVHLMPGLEVDLLDVAIEILDLHQLRVLIDRQHAEGLFFFEVFVPL